MGPELFLSGAGIPEPPYERRTQPSSLVMSDVTGHPKIYIGDDVNLFGHLAIASGRVLDNPTLVIRDRADIGHNVIITVNR